MYIKFTLYTSNNNIRTKDSGGIKKCIVLLQFLEIDKIKLNRNIMPIYCT